MQRVHRLFALSAWTTLALVWAALACGVWLSGLAASGVVFDASAPPSALPGLLDWQPVLWQRQPWRLWTAALVHWSGLHLLWNLVGCAALIAWGKAAALQGRQALAWWLAWPLTHLLLSSLADLPHYGGLSGVLHAGVAIGCWALLRQALVPRRWVGGVVLLGLCLKLASEQEPVRQWLGLGAAMPALVGAPGWVVAGAAHAAGVLAGLTCALLVDCAARLFGKPSRDAPTGKAASR